MTAAAAFQVWLTRHRETLRPLVSGNAIRASWQPSSMKAAASLAAKTKPPVPRLDQVFEDLAAQTKRGGKAIQALGEWGRQTGQWNAALDRAALFEEINQRQDIETEISRERVKIDFAAWSRWADTQPEKR